MLIPQVWERCLDLERLLICEITNALIGIFSDEMNEEKQKIL